MSKFLFIAVSILVLTACSSSKRTVKCTQESSITAQSSNVKSDSLLVQLFRSFSLSADTLEIEIKADSLNYDSAVSEDPSAASVQTLPIVNVFGLRPSANFTLRAVNFNMSRKDSTNFTHKEVAVSKADSTGDSRTVESQKETRRSSVPFWIYISIVSFLLIALAGMVIYIKHT